MNDFILNDISHALERIAVALEEQGKREQKAMEEYEEFKKQQKLEDESTRSS
jgi:hypothetical protein